MAAPSTPDRPSDPGSGTGSSHPPVALSSGTVLREEYRVEDVLGMGSFGITYRARDEHLQSTVAIKEYYPRHIAGRQGNTATVRPHSSAVTDQFAYGLEQFIGEGRTIARFDHPNVVDVRSYFEENGTGYLVMDHYEGQSLASYLAGQGDWLPEEEAVDLITDVLAGLQRVHEEGILHRDVDPQNIYRTTDGTAILLDFGAAREATHARSQQLSVIVKEGYAPIEQYSPDDDQGPQTDIYACAATLYKCLTGLRPPAATDRVQNDRLEAPRTVRPEVSVERSAAVMKGLSMHAEARPSTADAFASLLVTLPREDGDTVPGSTSPNTEEAPPKTSPEPTTVSQEHARPSWISFERIGLLIAALFALGTGALIYLQVLSSDETASTETLASSTAGPERSVAVLPFEVSGSGAQAWRDGMVTMLSMNLDGAGGLRAIADRRVFAAATQVDSSTIARRDLPLAIAERAGAQYAVIGSAVQLGGALRLGAEIREVGSGERLGQVEVESAPDSVTALTDQLTRKVLEVLLEKGEGEIPPVNMASITTESLDALSAFLKGEQHYRASNYERAVESYETAVAEDSTFALAYARLQSVRFWSGQDGVTAAIRKAYQLSDQLPERERRLIQGIYLWHQDRGLAAADSLRRLSTTYPNAPSIWYWLGETLFHSPVPHGLPEADTAFKRAIQLDPGLPSYYHHHVELAFVLHHDSTLAARRLEA
ncbi:MAG TPA: protein kinase, partial [Salinibacter sp.]|nr:protein kinase [Salinibacter sp.]